VLREQPDTRVAAPATSTRASWEHLRPSPGRLDAQLGTHTSREPAFDVAALPIAIPLRQTWLVARCRPRRTAPPSHDDRRVHSNRAWPRRHAVFASHQLR
jgi:hypothetical protein